MRHPSGYRPGHSQKTVTAVAHETVKNVTGKDARIRKPTPAAAATAAHPFKGGRLIGASSSGGDERRTLRHAGEGVI